MALAPLLLKLPLNLAEGVFPGSWMLACLGQLGRTAKVTLFFLLHSLCWGQPGKLKQLLPFEVTGVSWKGILVVSGLLPMWGPRLLAPAQRTFLLPREINAHPASLYFLLVPGAHLGQGHLCLHVITKDWIWFYYLITFLFFNQEALKCYAMSPHLKLL